MNRFSILLLVLAGCGGIPFTTGPLFAAGDDAGDPPDARDEYVADSGKPPVDAGEETSPETSPEASGEAGGCSAVIPTLGFPDPAYCTSGDEVPTYFNIYRPACQGQACPVCDPQTATPPACQCAGAYTCACLLAAGIVCPNAGPPSGCDPVGAELTIICPAPGG